MNARRIRISFIGAGDICERRHLPNLVKFADVELATVCNRSPESSRRVCEKWRFERTAESWRQVVEQPDVDAIFIGTWPYMHRELAIAALAARKHVFCQARMCMNWPEAVEMVAAATSHPGQVNMVCPSPFRVSWERTGKGLLDSGAIGPLHSVVVTSASSANRNSDQVSWREQMELSGLNILQVGIYAETLNAWCGEFDTLAATTQVFVRHKRDHQGNLVQIRVPQVVGISGTLSCGAVVTEHHSGLALGYDRSEIVLSGSEASCTIDLQAQEVRLFQTRAAKNESTLVSDTPDEWQVERQFVDAVIAAQRHTSWTVSPDFAEAARYMRKLQAIHDSARQSQVVKLAGI